MNSSSSYSSDNMKKSIHTLYWISLASISLCACHRDDNSSPCDGVCTEQEVCNEKTGVCEPVVSPSHCVTDFDCNSGRCSNSVCVDECHVSSDCDGDYVCTKGLCQPECTRNADCSSQQICKNQHCITECTDSDDCTGNLICQNNRCTAQCRINSDCDGNFKCRDNLCKPDCTTNDECAGNLVCRDNLCQNECVDASDCEGNWICRENRCLLECTESDDCAEAGFVCRNNQCRPLCETDADCGELHCQDGGCVACRRDGDCSNDQKCSKLNQCVDCLMDEDCSDNKICQDFQCVFECEEDSACDDLHPYCVDNRCAECGNSEQCSEPFVCRVGQCKPECVEDSDCPDRQKCSPEKQCKMCITHRDCGDNQLCYDDVCGICSEDDLDCDGVRDSDDVCPHNPEVSTDKDADCNFILNPDGTRTFVIYHVSEFERLKAEMEKEQPAASCRNTPDGETPRPGDCCSDDDVNSCSNDVSLSCQNGTLVQTQCHNGCDEKSCLSACIQNDLDNICLEQPRPAFKVKLAKDINLMQAGDADSIKQVGYLPVFVPQKNGMITSPYEIKDSQCVFRWKSLDIHDIELDGDGHVIYAQTDDGKKCSLVDPLFGNIEHSVIQNLILGYNVRGMISSTFAQAISNSYILSVSIKGNINLETEPVFNEVQSSSLLNEQGYLKNESAFSYSILSGSGLNNVYRDIQFVGDITMNTAYDLETYQGFNGLLGPVEHSIVEHISLTIPDHLYAFNRSLSLGSSGVKNTELKNIDVTVSDASAIFIHSTGVFNGLLHEANQSVISGPVTLGMENLYAPQAIVSHAVHSSQNLKVNAPIDINAKDISSAEYAVFSNYGVQLNDRVTVTSARHRAVNYYGFMKSNIGERFEKISNVHLSTGNVVVEKSFNGFAFHSKNVEMSDISIQNEDVTFLNNGAEFCGFSSLMDDACVMKNIDMSFGNVTASENAENSLTDSFYGVSKQSIHSINQLTVDMKDVSGFDVIYGISEMLSNNEISGVRLNYHDIQTKTASRSVSLNDYYGIAKEAVSSDIRDFRIEARRLISPHRVMALSEKASHLMLEQFRWTTGRLAAQKVRAVDLADDMKISSSAFNLGEVILQSPDTPVVLASNVVSMTLNNMALYADIFVSKSQNIPVMSGILSENISTKDIKLNRLFISTRYNQYSEAFEDILKKDLKELEINQLTTWPVIAANVDASLVITMNVLDKMYSSFDIDSQSVYWYRHSEEEVSSIPEFMVRNMDTQEFEMQFPGFDGSNAGIALSGVANGIPSKDTLTGCEQHDSECLSQQPWEKSLKKFVEYDGLIVMMPWLK